MSWGNETPLDRSAMRKVPAEDLSGGGREIKVAAFDQANDGQRGECLGPAGDGELGVERGGDLVAPVGEAIGARGLNDALVADGDDSGKVQIPSPRVDRGGERIHGGPQRSGDWTSVRVCRSGMDRRECPP